MVVVMSKFWLLNTNAMSTSKYGLLQIPAFRGNVLSPSSALKIAAVSFSETMVSTHKSTWRYKPQDQHRLKKLVSYRTYLVTTDM
jgi:hypothetical protein